MPATYIEFEEKEYSATSNKESFSQKLIRNILETVVPQANPDFDKLIGSIKYWMLEFDTDGNPLREIGLDESKTPIVKMPYNNNVGYWTDNNLKLVDFQRQFTVQEISKELFEDKWNLF